MPERVASFLIADEYWPALLALGCSKGTGALLRTGADATSIESQLSRVVDLPTGGSGLVTGWLVVLTATHA